LVFNDERWSGKAGGYFLRFAMHPDWAVILSKPILIGHRFKVKCPRFMIFAQLMVTIHHPLGGLYSCLKQFVPNYL
jgi:hypothetical protein